MSALEIFEDLPFTLSRDALAGRLRLTPARPAYAGLEALAAEARGLIRIRAAVAPAFIEGRGDDAVTISGRVFRSRVLSAALAGAARVFPFVATAGPALEAAAGACDDLFRQFALEEAANTALEEGIASLALRIGERWDVSGLSALSPGSLEDWPLAEQSPLFALLGDVDGTIGVRLTESLLMIPRKSVSGIFFGGAEGFRACRLCERAGCPSRKAPFDPHYAAGLSNRG